jgi:hypothetical protein
VTPDQTILILSRGGGRVLPPIAGRRLAVSLQAEPVRFAKADLEMSGVVFGGLQRFRGVVHN